MTQTTRSADGTTIGYDRLGDGPALVLVGGAFQYRAFDPRTAALAEQLANTFSVYHYDRRGRGDSGDTPPYTPQREIEDLAAVIDAAGGTAAVFAMSSGGALALDAAAAGLPISRLALYELTLRAGDYHQPLPQDYRQQLQQLPADDAVAYFLTTAAELPAEMVDGMRQSPVWGAFTAVASTLAYDAAFMDPVSSGRADTLHRWADITQHTLVADGGASPEWYRHAADQLAGVLPHATRATLPGQTHDAAPDVLAPVLRDFFTKDLP